MLKTIKYKCLCSCIVMAILASSLLSGCTVNEESSLSLSNGSATTALSAENSTHSSTNNSGNAELDSLYPVNNRGQTYGSFQDADSIGVLPELISVTATNGVHGYIYRDDYLVHDNEYVSKQENQARMDKLREASIKALCDFFFTTTATKADDTVVNAAYDIVTKDCMNPNWEQLTDQQKEALVELFPEKYRSQEVAQNALEAAMSVYTGAIPVYDIDGETIIGEFLMFG